MKLGLGVCASIAAASLAVGAQEVHLVSLDPNALGKAPIVNWPTFNGDYSGRRYSTLRTDAVLYCTNDDGGDEAGPHAIAAGEGCAAWTCATNGSFTSVV